MPNMNRKSVNIIVRKSKINSVVLIYYIIAKKGNANGNKYTRKSEYRECI